MPKEKETSTPPIKEPVVIRESLMRGVRIVTMVGDPLGQEAGAIVCPYMPGQPFDYFQEHRLHVARAAGKDPFNDAERQIIELQKGEGWGLLPETACVTVGAGDLPKHDQIIVPVITAPVERARHEDLVDTVRQSTVGVLKKAVKGGVSSVMFPIIPHVLHHSSLDALMHGTNDGLNEYFAKVTRKPRNLESIYVAYLQQPDQ